MPSFKSNLDIQQNQLLNAVLHILRDLPPNPVEGQLYYNAGKQCAYLWNGSYWIPWGSSSGGGGSEVKQFITTILNPSSRSGAIIIRLYEDLLAVRVDAHFSTVNNVYFNVDLRANVNIPGTNLTLRPMMATNDSNEYTVIDHPTLKTNWWLYLTVASGSGEAGTPIEGEVPNPTGGIGSEPPAVDGEVLGVLTVILTCTNA